MNSSKLSTNNMNEVRQPNFRNYTPVKIKLDKDTEVIISLEEIKESLEKDLYKNLVIGISIK